MLLPIQAQPVIRAVSTAKVFNAKIGIIPLQDLTKIRPPSNNITRSLYLQCQVCCESGGGDSCKAIPNCTC